MQRSVVDPEALREHYIICICEGNAEEAIMNALIDADQLIFSREQLVDEKITRLRKAKEIQTTFLGRDYEKPLDIVRILDSETDRFQVYNVYTKPEIEMLLILSEKSMMPIEGLIKNQVSTAWKICFLVKMSRERLFCKNISKIQRACAVRSRNIAGWERGLPGS